MGLAVGLAAALLLAGLPVTDRILIGADLFFITYLSAMALWMRRRSGDDLRDHFADADEGVTLIVAMALGAVTCSLYAITQTLVAARTLDGSPWRPVLALAAVPLAHRLAVVRSAEVAAVIAARMPGCRIVPVTGAEMSDSLRAGVSAAASTVFFSYIGFDAASTAGEEARDPKRDLPRSILLSMIIVTVLYVAVAVAAIGAREWHWFDGREAPLVQIMREITGAPWVAFIFAVTSVLAIFSVVLTVLFGQIRILLSMSRDGLVPRVFGVISPQTATPVRSTRSLASMVPCGTAIDSPR